MRRVFLDEIGDTSRWDNRYSDDRPNPLNYRSWHPMRQVRRRGIADAATWNFDTAAIEYVYEGLRAYLLEENAGGTVDFEEEAKSKFIVHNGRTYSPLGAIQHLIEIAEYILCDVDHIKVYGPAKKRKRAAVRERLLNNAYYKEHGNQWFLDWCCDSSAPHYLEEDRDHALSREFWEIWAKLHPYMWW